jgi:hypothetical protein
MQKTTSIKPKKNKQTDHKWKIGTIFSPQKVEPLSFIILVKNQFLPNVEHLRFPLKQKIKNKSKLYKVAEPKKTKTSKS